MAQKQTAPEMNLIAYIQLLNSVPSTKGYSVFDLESVDQTAELWRVMVTYTRMKSSPIVLLPDEIIRATKKGATKFLFKAKKIDSNVLSEAIVKVLSGAQITVGDQILTITIN